MLEYQNLLVTLCRRVYLSPRDVLQVLTKVPGQVFGSLVFFS